MDGRQNLDATFRLAIVPTVGPGHLNSIPVVKDTVVVLIYVTRTVWERFAIGVINKWGIINIGQFRRTGQLRGCAERVTSRIVQTVDLAVRSDVVMIEHHLHVRQARLPVFRRGETRVILCAGYGIEDHPGNPAVLSSGVIRLTPVNDVGLVQVELHRLGYGTFFRHCP